MNLKWKCINNLTQNARRRSCLQTARHPNNQVCWRFGRGNLTGNFGRNSYGNDDKTYSTPSTRILCIQFCKTKMKIRLLLSPFCMTLTFRNRLLILMRLKNPTSRNKLPKAKQMTNGNKTNPRKFWTSWFPTEQIPERESPSTQDKTSTCLKWRRNSS